MFPLPLQHTSARVLEFDHFREVLAQKRPKITLSLDHLLDAGDHAVLSEGGEITVPSPDADSSLAFAQEEIEEVLRRALKGRDNERAILIFKLRFFQEMSHAEIIETLGIDLTPVGISSIINRIVKRIRPILASKYGIRQK